jgi:hypothetical protein
MRESRLVRLDCTTCHFDRVVDPDTDGPPYELVVEHGRETGHTVAITRLDPSAADPTESNGVG